MRAVQLLFVLASVAIVANAECPSRPSTNPFARSTCVGYLACDALLCICAGGNGTSSATCLASTSASCGVIQTCFAAYFTCLSALATVRNTTTDATCADFGTAIHQAQLGSLGAYGGSSLQQSCRYNLCQITNVSATAANCSNLFTSASSNVCNNATANGTPAPTFAPGTLPPAVYALLVTLRLSGNNWGPILSNPALYASLAESLATDLATLLGVLAQYIDIISLTQGSLNVQYAVLPGSGKNVADLTTASNLATAGTTWLSSTQSTYSANGGEALSVLSSTSETQAPTPAPGGEGGSPSAASATSVVIAAAAAIVACLAL